MNEADIRKPPSEFPSPEKQRIMGEFLFLAMRSSLYAGLPLVKFRQAFDPPIDAQQFTIFRIGGVPRGLFTWALLTEDAERRFKNGDGLLIDEWSAGDRFWIVDMIAPYGRVGAMMSQWLRKPGNIPTREFSFLRVDPESKKPTKIVHVDHDAPKGKRIWVEGLANNDL